MKLRFYEFFAGAGLARLGLGEAWECVWANDISPDKAAVYRENFGDEHFVPGDVALIDPSSLPTPADMAWASFPCQDLSLAGWRKGIGAERSGAFWAFWRIMDSMATRQAKPPVIVIENVVGLLYGDSFAGLCEAMAALDMQFGALVMDARYFVPQSRPRVFLVAVDSQLDCGKYTATEPSIWSPKTLVEACHRLPDHVRERWRWWNLPAPVPVNRSAAKLIEDDPRGVEWHTPEQTDTLLGMMNEANLDKVTKAVRLGRKQVGFLYKRIRDGVQRAEVRFDMSGCLRTPQGGSSRQTVLVIDNSRVRSRLLSPREAARLMGVPDTFRLPGRYNAAYKAMGDGVAVPVVFWLGEHLLRALAEAARNRCARSSEDWRSVTDLGVYRVSSERRAAEWLLTQPHKTVLSQQS